MLAASAATAGSHASAGVCRAPLRPNLRGLLDLPAPALQEAPTGAAGHIWAPLHLSQPPV
eukprot:scaffold95980_cov20-Tisochrysis_lutea.AAC.1